MNRPEAMSLPSHQSLPQLCLCVKHYRQKDVELMARKKQGQTKSPQFSSHLWGTRCPWTNVSEPFLGGVGQRSPAIGMSPPFCTWRYCSWIDESDRQGDDDLRVFLRMRYLSEDEPSILHETAARTCINTHQLHYQSTVKQLSCLSMQCRTVVET